METLQKNSNDKALLSLLLSGVITVVIWNIPFGNFLLYPFTILGTWFHEMGHGLMAIVLGGTFHHLEIFVNGSGLARSSYPDDNLIRAMVSAAGLLAPPVIGAIFILAGSKKITSIIALFLLSISMIASSIIWIRTGIGFIIIMSLGILLLIAIIKVTKDWHQLIIQFIGVQACISTYEQLDYLFMKQGVVNGEEYLSDTGQIAAQLSLTYWIWGAIIAFISFALLVGSLNLAYRDKSTNKKNGSLK